MRTFAGISALGDHRRQQGPRSSTRFISAPPPPAVVKLSDALIATISAGPRPPRDSNPPPGHFGGAALARAGEVGRAGPATGGWVG